MPLRGGLAGAAVTGLERAGTGVLRDTDGRFRLKRLPGKYTFQVSYLRYSHQCIPLNLSRDEVVNVRLKATDNRLTEVVVTGQRNQDNVISRQTSVEVVD